MCSKSIYLNVYLAVFILDMGFSAAYGQPGLVGYWKLDETSGMTAVDSSGNGNNGTLFGDVTWRPGSGRSGGTLLYGGANSAYVELPTTGMSNMLSLSGTLTMWAYLTNPQPYQTRYFFGHTTQPSYNNRIQLYMNNQNTDLDLGLGDSHTTQLAITTLETETWFHLTLTWSNGDYWDFGNYKVYINGELVADGSYTGLSYMHDFAWLGNTGDPAEGIYGFGGMLDEVRLYNRALSASDIDAIMYSSGSQQASGPSPTEEFLGDGVGDGFDLTYSSVTFTPSSDGTSYTFSRQSITQLPTNPALGTDLGLGDDDYIEVEFSDPVNIRIFNQNFSTFFVGSNGYVTFTQSDQDASQTLEEHFDILRISGLYCDLAPNVTGSVKAQYCMNCVAVTWLGVQEFSNTAPNTFQIEIFFDGRIRLSWLEINADECIVGLSNGGGLPTDFVETDFSDAENGLLKASEPSPIDDAKHFDTWASLTWRPGYTAVSHDVYVGSSYSSVYNGTRITGAFRGNQNTTMTTLGFPGGPYPNGLVLGRTYYWRIDEIEADGTVYKGDVWNFTVEEYVSIPIFDVPQTLPQYEELLLPTPPDLTFGGTVSELTLYFRGDPTGSADPIYVKVIDSTGAIATLIHPDPEITLVDEWAVWTISINEIAAAGADPTNVKEVNVGKGEGDPSHGAGYHTINCTFKSGTRYTELIITVVNSEGDPIEGAEVTVINENSADKHPAHYENGNTTDRDGECPAAPHRSDRQAEITYTYTVTVKINGNIVNCEPREIEILDSEVQEEVVVVTEETCDQPTEEFLGDDDGDGFDLAYSSVTFTPTPDGTSYFVSRQSITQLPTNPALGTDLGLGDDDYIEVEFSDPVNIRIFNQNFSTFFVGSNGYVTFTQSDQDASQTLEEHFEILRISGLYCDLAPNVTGSVKAQYCMNCVAVTWLGVQEFSNTAPNTFQIEMFFDGRIRLSWLEINADECIVGLSNGGGLPGDFMETDFSDF